MTKVKVTYFDSKICKFRVYGHSESASKGEDLVCAGVSSVTIGALNTIDTMCNDSCDIIIDEADIRIDVNKDSDTLQTILNMLLIQLESIAYVHSEFIKIMKEEV